MSGVTAGSGGSVVAWPTVSCSGVGMGLWLLLFWCLLSSCVSSCGCCFRSRLLGPWFWVCVTGGWGSPVVCPQGLGAVWWLGALLAENGWPGPGPEESLLFCWKKLSLCIVGGGARHGPASCRVCRWMGRSTGGVTARMWGAIRPAVGGRDVQPAG